MMQYLGGVRSALVRARWAARIAFMLGAPLIACVGCTRFFGEGPDPAADGTVNQSGGASGGGWFTIVQTSGTPHRISAVHGLVSANSTTLFWAQPPDKIEECTLSAPSSPGGPLRCSGSPETFATSNGPDHLIFANDVLYWADDPSSGDGNLNACQVTGSSPCNGDGGVYTLRNGGAAQTTRIFKQDATNLYWVENEQTGGSIFRCPFPCLAAPASPIVMSSSPISAFTVLRTALGSLSTGTIVWSTGDQIWSCAPNGSSCPPTNVAILNFAPLGILSDAQPTVFVTGNGAVNLLQCPTTGCSLNPVDRIPNDSPTLLNSDASNLYIATAAGAIYASSRNAGGLTILASGQGQINGLTSDGTYLYWTSSNGIIGGVAK